jgi:hypothetical protein
VFLISLVANTFLETWNNIVTYTTQLSTIGVLLLLASNIGVQSAFYMIYILAQGFKHIIVLLHPANIIIGGFKRCTADTPREKLAASFPPHYAYHLDMAQHMLIFLVVLNFSTISPLILPLGLAYLCLIYFITAFETTYTSYQEHDGFGVLFPLISNRIILCLFFHHLIMAGMFILATFWIGVIFCALCFIGTLLFVYCKLRHFKSVSKYGLIDDVSGDGFQDYQDDDGRGYIHPGMWDPAIDLEDIYRLSYSIQTARQIETKG